MAKMVQRHIRIPAEMDELLRQIGERRGENLNATFVRMIWEQIETETGHKISKLGISQVHDIGPKSATVGTDQVTKEESIDPRHGLVRELILERHREIFKVECEWGPGEAGQLGLLLRTNPKWGLTDMKRMVENRFVSEGVTSERPMVWLKDLGMYAAGPLDRFKKVMNAGGGGDGRGQEGARRVSPSEQRADDIKRSIINAFATPIGDAVQPDGVKREGPAPRRITS